MEKEKIVTIENKKNERFLRGKAAEFDFKKHKPKEIRDLVRLMRETMKKAQGVGLSANQIGLPYKMFVAQVPDAQGKPKFYAIFNPKIEKTSSEKEPLEEGCLSVPETYGLVERSLRVTLVGLDQQGKKIKIKAWGLLARVFQHEVDHLNGALFIDKAKGVQRVAKK
jgi:peptide deformylase